MRNIPRRDGVKMTDANERKWVQSRGGHQSFTGPKEVYDVEEAICQVRNLGHAQALTQSRRLHQYRLEWIDQLEARYRGNPGKPLIHLSDLPRKTAIRVSEDGLALLRELWETIKRMHGTRAAKKLGLENIYSCAIARYYAYITLESLRRAEENVNWNIDQLEPYVMQIKCHKNNWPKEIEPNLPFDFLNEDGAAILAYYTDSKHANCVFTNKDMELHELVKGAVERVVGRMRVKTSVYEGITETNWSLLLPTLVAIAGVNTKPRQKIANNPAPLWLFTAPKNVVSAYLRALWTAEGMARFMRCVQTVVVPQLEPYRHIIATKPAVTPYNRLPTEAKETIYQHPSFLLASAVLLQRSFGIDATLKPSVAYSDYRKELTVLWTTEITSITEINKFSKLIDFDGTAKHLLLRQRIHESSSPSPFYSKKVAKELISLYPIGLMMLREESRYKVYASVYPRPPPSRQIRSLAVAIFDQKGRLVQSLGSDMFLGEYGHHFTKTQARIGVESMLEAEFGISMEEGDVNIVTEKEVERLIKKAKRGGFHVYVSAENVPSERALYLKAIYRLELGNRVWPEKETMEIIRTVGNEDEAGLKKLVADYLWRAYRYSLETDEIHFVTQKELQKLRSLTA